MPTMITIDSFAEGRGVATTADGTALAFTDEACAGFTPAPGKQACAVIVVTVGPTREAVLIRATPDADPNEVLVARATAMEAARRYFFEGPAAAPTEEPRPIDVVKAHLTIPAEALALLAPEARERVAERVVEIAIGDDVALADFWAAEAVETGLAFDPCFVPLGGADGDMLGLFAYPPAIAAGHLPVVFGSHEGDPTFTWVAESARHFAALLEDPAAARGAMDDRVALAMRAVDQEPDARHRDDLAEERRLVWHIQDEGGLGEAPALAEELRALYARLGWNAALAMLDEARRSATADQDRLTEWYALEARVAAEFEAEAAKISVKKRAPTIPPSLLAKMIAGASPDKQVALLAERLPDGRLGTVATRDGQLAVTLDDGKSTALATCTGFEPHAGDRVLLAAGQLFLVARP